MEILDQLKAALARWKPEERCPEMGTKDYALVVVPPDVKRLLREYSDLLPTVYQHMADSGFEPIHHPVGDTNFAVCWRRTPKQ